MLEKCGKNAVLKALATRVLSYGSRVRVLHRDLRAAFAKPPLSVHTGIARCAQFLPLAPHERASKARITCVARAAMNEPSCEATLRNMNSAFIFPNTPVGGVIVQGA